MIENEDEGGVIIKTEEIVKNKESFVLVGRFLTEKNINITVWRPKEWKSMI